MHAVRVLALGALALPLLLLVAAPALAAPGDVLGHNLYFQGGVNGDDTGWVVKVDPVGDPFFGADSATGPASQEMLTWATSPIGAYWWEQHWNGSAGTYDFVHDMGIDGGGNVYLAGATNNSGAGLDYILLRYLNNGTYSRARLYNGPLSSDDEAMAVTVDTAGNACMTGNSLGAGGDRDIVTVMVDATGVQTWADRVDSRWHGDDDGLAIARSGSWIYVAGNVFHPGHGADLVLIKYDAATGKRVWTRYYDDPLHRNEHVSDVIATPTSVYVCGSGKSGAIKPGDAMLVRFSSSGARKWVRFFTGGWGGFDEGFMDAQRTVNGAVAVTGIACRPGSAQDMATVVYRNNGSIRWARFKSSSGTRSDVAFALDVDGSGRIYITGALRRAAGTSVVRTICYGPAGGTVWSTPFPVSPTGDDAAYDIEVGGTSVWVTGTSFQPATGNDFLTIRYER